MSPAYPSDRSTRLLIASHNRGKFQELASLLSTVPFTLVSLDDLGIVAQSPETGSTLEENASQKAQEYARLSGMTTLADDSGLEVDALGGEPGVRSSRYAGDGATDDERIEFLLEKLNNVEEADRGARFRCVIAIAMPDGMVQLHSGECNGSIARAPSGASGFGYDPVFMVDQLGVTMAELTQVEKNRVSHRGRAATSAAAALRQQAAELPGRP